MNNVGIAFGIFDMVSLEKVYFLNTAATKCDLLRVGLLSDGIVEEITGKDPVVNEECRIEILEGFKSVNEVILVDNIDEIDAISKRYDIAFLYNDIKNSDMINPPKNCTDVKIRYNKKSSDYMKVKSLEGVIGYTTGVYDLFHIGHLNLLKRAKASCDSLIVGVSTDELVMQYKNKSPRMSFSERVQIIDNLKCVDAVVVQQTMDKFNAWQKLRFDCLFHGDDWKGSELYSENEKKLKSVGVEMVYFPYTKGISSTILSEKILKK